jgi:hypothetical protein
MVEFGRISSKKEAGVIDLRRRGRPLAITESGYPCADVDLVASLL